ncbi:MAG: hypothetical protein AB9919_05670 [Geobacteraceae bacterium]
MPRYARTKETGNRQQGGNKLKIGAGNFRKVRIPLALLDRW